MIKFLNTIFLLMIAKPAFALAPLVYPLVKGLGWLATSLGLGAKAIILTAAAFKAAAVGSAFLIKGIMFTKTGALLLTVAAGAATYAETTDSTIDTLEGLGYKVDNTATLPMVRPIIQEAVKNRNTYTAKYCLSNGEKILIPNEYIVCPMDGSKPLLGHEFRYTNEKPS